MKSMKTKTNEQACVHRPAKKDGKKEETKTDAENPRAFYGCIRQGDPLGPRRIGRQRFIGRSRRNRPFRIQEEKKQQASRISAYSRQPCALFYKADISADRSWTVQLGHVQIWRQALSRSLS